MFHRSLVPECLCRDYFQISFVNFSVCSFPFSLSLYISIFSLFLSLSQLLSLSLNFSLSQFLSLSHPLIFLSIPFTIFLSIYIYISVLVALLRLVIKLMPISHGNIIPSRHGQRNVHRPHLPSPLNLTRLLKMNSGRKLKLGNGLRPIINAHGDWTPATTLESGSP